jgi:hypothetical protein
MVNNKSSGLDAKKQYIWKLLEGLDEHMNNLVDAHKNGDYTVKNKSYKMVRKHIEALYDLGHITYKVALLLIKKLHSAVKLAFSEAKKIYSEIFRIIEDVKNVG